MAYESDQFDSARVVVLSPGDPHDVDHPWPELAGSFECVAVCSPYEAAAEMLCGGVVGLVVDLNLMARRHGKLLDIARQADVRVFGLGAIPAGLSSDDLKGVCLVDRASLLSELQRAMAARLPAVADAPPVDLEEPLIESMAEEQPEEPAEEDAPPPPPHRTIEVPGQSVAPTEWADEPLLAAARRFLEPRGIQIDTIVNVGAPVDRPQPRVDESSADQRPSGWASQ